MKNVCLTSKIPFYLAKNLQCMNPVLYAEARLQSNGDHRNTVHCFSAPLSQPHPEEQ